MSFARKNIIFSPVHLLVRVRAEDGRPPDDVYDLAGNEEGDSEAEGGQGADLGGLRTEGEAAADELLAEVGQQRDAVCGREKRFFFPPKKPTLQCLIRGFFLPVNVQNM